MIELDTYARLQVDLLQNELRARLNDGNITSSMCFIFFLPKIATIMFSQDYYRLVVR